MTIINKKGADHYKWGDDCDGWPLVAQSGLSVKQERMPPGATETRHFHQSARQVFYVLSGVLTMELEGAHHSLGPQDAIEIAPGAPHQAKNSGAGPVDFLVISAPSTESDRVDA